MSFVLPYLAGSGLGLAAAPRPRTFTLVVNATYFDKDLLTTNREAHRPASMQLVGSQAKPGDETLVFRGFHNPAAIVPRIFWDDEHTLGLDISMIVRMGANHPMSVNLLGCVLRPADFNDLFRDAHERTVEFSSVACLLRAPYEGLATVLTRWKKDDCALGTEGRSRWGLRSVECEIKRDLWNDQMNMIADETEMWDSDDKRSLLVLP